MPPPRPSHFAKKDIEYSYSKFETHARVVSTPSTGNTKNEMSQRNTQV